MKTASKGGRRLCCQVLLEYGQRRLVVRLAADLADQFVVQDLVVLVQYHHGAGSDASQRAVGDGYAVVLEKVGAAHGRQVDHVLQAFGTAEARLSERQVGGNAQHHGVIQLAGTGVEGAHRSGAGRGVDAWENIQHFALAGQAGQADIGQIGADQGEGRSLLADLWQLTIDLYRGAMQGYLSHWGVLFCRGMKTKAELSMPPLKKLRNTGFSMHHQQWVQRLINPPAPAPGQPACRRVSGRWPRAAAAG